jgi:hypothetical protein
LLVLLIQAVAVVVQVQKMDSAPKQVQQAVQV